MCTLNSVEKGCPLGQTAEAVVELRVCADHFLDEGGEASAQLVGELDDLVLGREVQDAVVATLLVGDVDREFGLFEAGFSVPRLVERTGDDRVVGDVRLLVVRADRDVFELNRSFEHVVLEERSDAASLDEA